MAFAFPTFFIGLLFLKFVSIRWGSSRLPAYTPITENPWLWVTGLILPAITLALVYMAGYIRMTRAFVLETMTEDYIRTARAKGLTRRKVIGKHTLRAVLTPAGDPVRPRPGRPAGRRHHHRAGLQLQRRRQDVGQCDPAPRPALVVGIVLLLASFVIIANIIVDLLYAVIDPRVRLG